MAGSELKLPGNFEAAKVYRLRGSTLNAWRDALLADRVVAGAGITETGTPQGRIFKAAGAGTADLYHVINRLGFDAEGHVIIGEPEQYTMLFQKGVLQWVWDSTSGNPEPTVPDGVTTVYSVNLEEVCP